MGLNGGPTWGLLAHALGLGPDTSDLAPAARRRMLLQALQTWLFHRAAERPVLIVAEDLHWSDPSLLGRYVEWQTSCQIGGPCSSQHIAPTS